MLTLKDVNQAVAEGKTVYVDGRETVGLNPVSVWGTGSVSVAVWARTTSGHTQLWYKTPAAQAAAVVTTSDACSHYVISGTDEWACVCGRPVCQDHVHHLPCPFDARSK